MPASLNQLRRGPRLVDYILIAAGMLLIGWGLNGYSPLRSGVQYGAETVTRHGTRYVTSTRTVSRVVHGKVIRQHDKVYVRVPLIVVHTDHHVIRVPAHKLPLRSASATVANPLVTVHILVPTTVYVPTTVTTTETVTDVVPTTITTTITLPIVASTPLPAD